MQATTGSVLIVEDEEALAEVLDDNLRRAGFETFIAADGLSACRLLGQHRPDLVLLDILLPDLDGWEICKLIRAHHDEGLASTPILMLSALGTTDDRVRGAQLGADAYLVKPYALREVRLLVEQHVRRRHQGRGLRTQMETLRREAELQAEIQTLLFHEFRNRMHVIEGFAGLLARRSSPDSASYLAAIQRSSAYLSTLAEEFLMVRRVEEGRLSLPREPAELTGLLREMLGLFEGDGSAAGRFRLAGADQALLIETNPAAVRLVLANLIENALKYSLPASPISIRLQPAATRVTVEVSNAGAEIETDEQEAIFAKFYRGRRQESRVHGSGLGLYLARTLARACGGDLELELQPGGVALFRLRLNVPATSPGP